MTPNEPMLARSWKLLPFAFCALTALGCGGSEAQAVSAATVAQPDERFVFFGAGSAQITSNDGFFSLGYVVALLDVEPHFYVLVVGHADRSGSAEVNEKLSFARARAVRQVLLDHGVEAKRVVVAAPKETSQKLDPELSRRADIYVYDPVAEEVSHRLGYEVEIRAE